jgi:hypothetical protein
MVLTATLRKGDSLQSKTRRKIEGPEILCLGSSKSPSLFHPIVRTVAALSYKLISKTLKLS